MHPTEEQILRLLPALEELKGDDAGAVTFARAAADNLRQLVGTGVFGALTGRSLALMRTIANDQNMRPADRTVAKVLLAALDSRSGCTKLSQPEICHRSGLSRSMVRSSLRRLADSGYFAVIEPSPEEWLDGDHVRRYRPQFEG
ncbi:winged helix-turn-helix domain-containing protein [Bradyrhizobium elkanii]